MSLGEEGGQHDIDWMKGQAGGERKPTLGMEVQEEEMLKVYVLVRYLDYDNNNKLEDDCKTAYLLLKQL